jgi:hypothetical protein
MVDGCFVRNDSDLEVKNHQILTNGILSREQMLMASLKAVQVTNISSPQLVGAQVSHVIAVQIVTVWIMIIINDYRYMSL